jgi:Membrane proteins related to metalloendopeptidases
MDSSKLVLGIVGAIVAVILVFALLWFAVTSYTVQLMITSLPSWAQEPVYWWFTGQPGWEKYVGGGTLPNKYDGTGSDPGITNYSPTTLSIPWNGYVGPNSLLAGVPFASKPELNCRFHDPNYPSHEGVDFPGAVGTSVIATMGGEVTWARPDGAFGNLVVVENGIFQVMYAHLCGSTGYPNELPGEAGLDCATPFAVGEGQIVVPGQTLGYRGSSGNSTGPHTHYQVNMAFVNPWGNRYIDSGKSPAYNEEEASSWTWGNTHSLGQKYLVPSPDSDLYKYLMAQNPPGISFITVNPELYFDEATETNKIECPSN